MQKQTNGTFPRPAHVLLEAALAMPMYPPFQGELYGQLIVRLSELTPLAAFLTLVQVETRTNTYARLYYERNFNGHLEK